MTKSSEEKREEIERERKKGTHKEKELNTC
jgi:hypothetical protein